VERIDCQQHPRVVTDVEESGNRNRHEPYQHDRAKEAGDAARPAPLRRKQGDQNGDRKRDDGMLECRRRELQSFDGRQNGNRRSNHRVAKKHRGADHAQQEHQCGRPSQRPRCQCRERKRATLAVVVGPQQNENVFYGDDNDECPQDEREHTEDYFACDRPGLAGRKRGLSESV